MGDWKAPEREGRRPRAMLSPRAIAYGPRLAQIVITRKCNLDCGYCNEYDVSSEPVPAEIIKSHVDKLAAMSTLFLEYTGGETLLHPDLLELVRYASKFKFPERWIITNGYLLDPEIIRGLNDAGLTHLQVSVDGVTPNSTTVKVLKPLRKKLEYLQRHAEFTVQVNAVLGAGNDEEALEVAAFARDAGFRPRVSIIHDGDGQSSLTDERKQLLARVYEVVGKRWKESGDYRSKLMRDGEADFKCRAGSRYLYIDEFGLVNWCSQQRGVFTKPFADYTWDDLKEQFYTRKECAPRCTVGCVRSASRFDEWRSQDNSPEVLARHPATNADDLIPTSNLLRRPPPLYPMTRVGARVGARRRQHP